VAKHTIAAESGGFKWLSLGRHEVIHDEAGRVLAHILKDASTAPPCPIIAVVGAKEIGRYISAETARAAVEDYMSESRRTTNFNAGKLLDKATREWFEDQTY